MTKSGSQKKVSSFNAYFRKEYKVTNEFLARFQRFTKTQYVNKKSVFNTAQIEKII